MKIAGKEISNKTKKGLILGYIALLVVSGLYINIVLSSNMVEVDQTEKKEKEVEVKPAKVYLTVFDGVSKKEYHYTLQNQDSVIDFLEKLRNNKNFKYEKTAHTYGLELDNINGLKAPEGYKWRLFSGENDITAIVQDVYLEDEERYELNLIKFE